MKSLYSVILVLSLTFASCDFPAYIDNITDVNTIFFSRTQTTARTQTTEAAYSFAFATKAEDHKVKLTEGSYKWEVVEKNKLTSDTRAISYRSSNKDIATVNNAGKVTLKRHGTVIITVEKAEKGAHEKVSDTYTLYITMKPKNREELAIEVYRAMRVYENNAVDLNYIDTSDITNMKELFTPDDYGTELTEGYDLDLHKFEGDISKWDVSNVTTMEAMFQGATKFNSDISKWDVSAVTSMHGMFWGATKFNSNISNWDVSSVINMWGMFNGATKFTQNLNAWGSKLNVKIRNNWNYTNSMFSGSGLAGNLPDWCDTVPDCKNKQ